MTDLGLYGALAYYGCISYNISHFFSFNCLTPILTAHNHSRRWGKSQQSNDGNLLCSGLLVESVGADRQDYLRTRSSWNQTGHTQCLILWQHTREPALTHHTFKASWHTLPWEWHFWTHLCLNRLIPLSLRSAVGIQQLFWIIKEPWLNAGSSGFKKVLNPSLKYANECT